MKENNENRSTISEKTHLTLPVQKRERKGIGLIAADIDAQRDFSVRIAQIWQQMSR